MNATESKFSTRTVEYPREGCPECNGPVKPVLATCDLDEEHERYDCLDKACGEFNLGEDDLVWIKSEAEYDDPDRDLLNAGALLTAGKVLPSMIGWVSTRLGIAAPATAGGDQ